MDSTNNHLDTPIMSETPKDEDGDESDHQIINPKVIDDEKKNEDTKLSKEKKLMLLPILLVFVILFMLYSSLAPFYPPKAKEKGVKQSIIGFVFSICPAVTCIGCPIVGAMIPKVGIKSIFIAGTTIVSMCYIVFSFIDHARSSTLFIAASFIIRFIEGVGISCILTGYFSIAMEIYSKHLNYAFGLQQIAIGFGTTIGPILSSGLYKVGGFLAAFMFLALAMLVLSPINLHCMANIPKRPKFRNKNLNKTSFTQIFKICEVFIAVIVVIANGCMFGFLYPTLETAVKDALELEEEQIALLFPVLGGSYAIMAFVWSHILTLIGRGSFMMMIGTMLCSIIFLMLGPSPIFPSLEMKLWLLIVLLIFLGCFSAMQLAPTLEFMQKGVINNGMPDNLTTYGLVSGIWSSCISLGECIGPAYGGALMEFYGFSLACTVESIICFCVFLILLFYTLYIKFCKEKFETHETVKDTEDDEDAQNDVIHSSLV